MNTAAAQLAASPFFLRVPRDAVAASAPLWSLRNLVSDQLFCRQGDPGDAIAILMLGECAAEVDGVEVGRIRVDEMLGEISAFFPDNQRAASVVAKARCTFLVLPAAGLRKLRAARSPV